ncbi:MAG: sodium:solute symporter [Bacteroidales bacterium]|nr:sodium:solute symporter [Bacteroidales bacterium]
MKPEIVLAILIGYFAILILVAYFTSKKAGNDSFFLGNRKSPWYIVAFGMIGASLSGVTFISVPGWVGSSEFSYMPMVLGYLVGYVVIANILMPLYYKLNLTSIYSYLEGRFGKATYKTGASFFLLSRVIGASFRLFLVANVLQFVIFSAWGIPFELTVFITIALIWLYTFKGGIKTIIWTDTLQTLFMLLAVGFSVYYISGKLDLNFGEMVGAISNSEFSGMFLTDWSKGTHFIQQFVSGIFITIVMTGLDQDMMQKNLSCKNIGDAKKNMYWFSLALIPVNLLFLSLGALLFIFIAQTGIISPEHAEIISADADLLFPIVATQYMQPIVGIFFIVGLIAAAYSSADSALTSLTTSFTVDILGAVKKGEKRLRKTRIWVHVLFSFILMIAIMIFNLVNDQSVIKSVFTAAGYTYGPLLGLYAYGLFTRKQVIDKWVPLVAVLAPIITFLLNHFVIKNIEGYKIGFELLILNGILTIIGLLIISTKSNNVERV